MRVLAVGNLYPPHDLGGGYESVWRAATEHLRAQGHEVRILASDHRSPGGPPDEAGSFRELRWYWLDHEFPRQSLRDCLAIERHNSAVMARHLGEFSPDVVAWWSMGGMSMRLLEQVRREGVPAVAFVHDDWLDYGRRVDAWHRRVLSRRVRFEDAAHYAFVSAATRDRAAASGVAPRATSILHSGIADSLLDPAPAPAQAWEWRLLCVGRIDPRKGLETAIRALAELPPEATLRIAGDGPPEEVARLEALALELGVRDRLVLLGRQAPEAVARLYGECDAVVFPVTWAEPWGLVPLEAMARGRPAVATGTGGSAEFLRDGENCLLFEPGDAGALAEALARLAGDADLRGRLRAAGIETAAGHTESIFNAGVEAELERAGSRG